MDKQELGKILEQFILRFEREPKNDPELSWFHKFDSKGKVTGVRDMEIVDYIVENVSFFRDSVYLNSDYSMVERILQNLLTNAIRYSSGDIKIEFKAGKGK